MGNDEKRSQSRGSSNTECEIALMIDNNYYSCNVINISSGGALLEITSQDTSELRIDKEGVCYINYQDEDFEYKCRIVRISNKQLAIAFWGMDIDQHFFIQRIIEGK